MNVPARLTSRASGATNTNRTVTSGAGRAGVAGQINRMSAAAIANAGARTQGRMRRRLPLGAQLRREIGDRDLAVQQLLHQGMKVALAHVWSLRCSRNRS